jgi:hypothetical protein
MDKVVIIVVLILLVVIILAFLSGWTSEKEPPISRFPTNTSPGRDGENFLSQTVPTAVFEMYLKAREAFEDYGLQVGYKFKNDTISWEFYTLGSNIDFEQWTECYREMFPYGHEFILPPLSHNEDIFCISMDITEDTYSNEYVDQLNIYLNVYGTATYEYTLKPDGVFSLKGHLAYSVKTTGKKKLYEVAQKAIRLGFDVDAGLKLIKKCEELGWYGSIFSFQKIGKEIGLRIYLPDSKTALSYFQTQHPNYTGATVEMLSKIQEIAIYLDDSVPDTSITRDAFYIGF